MSLKNGESKQEKSAAQHNIEGTHHGNADIQIL